MLKLLSIITLIILPAFAVADKPDDKPDTCGNNEQARVLARLIRTDIEQKRANIRCNAILTNAAEAKAKEMSEFGLVTHNLSGSPNSRLRHANYKLPDYYGKGFNSNQVEAIAGGYSNATEVWDAFKQSEGHRKHLLGELEFYLEQDEIGVAFIKDRKSPHSEYWAVYLARGYQKNQYNSGNLSEIPNKSLFILQQPKPEQ